MRVFLTGGTGLVGSHAADRLRAAGHDVVALVRASADSAFLARIGAALVAGDVTGDAERLAAAMARCDAVVHAAALVFRPASRETYRRVNVEAVERVLRAAAAAGATRVIHVSSVAVYGGAGDGGPVHEEAWLERDIPAGALYARSKRDAERAAWRLHDAGLIRLTTVRPTVIYGERDRLVTPILARLVRLPVIPLPGGGHSAAPVVYAGNVADAIVAALHEPRSEGKAYNLVEARAISVRDLVACFSRELGARPRFLTLPAGLVLAGAAAGDAVARILPGISGNLRRGARLLLHGNPYDAARARRELGWTGRLSHTEALARTAAWWREARRRHRPAPP